MPEKRQPVDRSETNDAGSSPADDWNLEEEPLHFDAVLDGDRTKNFTFQPIARPPQLEQHPSLQTWNDTILLMPPFAPRQQKKAPHPNSVLPTSRFSGARLPVESTAVSMSSQNTVFNLAWQASNYPQAFENTSTSVAASQMRNALNNLADTVADPDDKKVC